MNTVQNSYKIDRIEFTQDVQCYCPLGNEFYTAEVEVIMSPNLVLPDYCDVDKFIRGLSGSRVIIEELVFNIFSYLDTHLIPNDLTVIATVCDAIHLPVKVIKSK